MGKKKSIILIVLTLLLASCSAKGDTKSKDEKNEVDNFPKKND